MSLAGYISGLGTIDVADEDSEGEDTMSCVSASVNSSLTACEEDYNTAAEEEMTLLDEEQGNFWLKLPSLYFPYRAHFLSPFIMKPSDLVHFISGRSKPLSNLCLLIFTPTGNNTFVVHWTDVAAVYGHIKRHTAVQVHICHN